MKMTASDFYFIDRITIIGGIFVSLATYIFGKYWFLFVGLFLLNVGDCISGSIAAYLAGEVNSSVGLKGIIKKFGYWIFVCLGFGLSSLFIGLGEAIGIDLGVTISIGYFVLGSLIINEARSIMENLVRAGYHPPKILIKGLEVASKALEPDVSGEEDEEEKE